MIPDKNILWLLEKIIASFHSGNNDKGLPLGNLTSQLFCNVYMNEFDQFVKRNLKAKYYQDLRVCVKISKNNEFRHAELVSASVLLAKTDPETSSG